MNEVSIHPSRRAVLGKGLALGAAGLFANLTHLQRRALAAATLGGGNYKALVCVYLYGGNDGFNVVVPTDPVGYSVYAASRLGLAVPQNSLLPILPANPQGGTWGLHPGLAALQSHFASGKLAVVGNVGPLVAPATKAQILSNSVPLPYQLFSHYDQTYQWMTSVSNDSAATGWCGRIAENLAALNGASPVPMNISLEGTQRLQVGPNSAPYNLDSSGPIAFEGFDDEGGPARKAAFEALLAASSTNKFQQAYAGQQVEAMQIEGLLTGVLAGAPPITTVFPSSYLGKQLAMVAKMISVQAAVGHQRQIFLVGKGGFDTHDGQNQKQGNLFGDVAQCMAAFHSAMEEIGYGPQVTAFTASDFGRTLSSNGKGSDHGWGSHHLVLGGAVQGGDFYGTMPNLALDGPQDIGGGRIIPTTSVDQFAATLGRWFGVSAGDLLQIFPNLSNFQATDLGFLT